MERAKRIGFFLFVPLFFFFSIFHALERDGTYFQSAKMDPDYIYLVSSLAVRVGKTPYHWDHPGAVLQVLGAGVVWAGTAGLSNDEAELKVFRESEAFVHSILIVLALFHALAAAAAGYLAWRVTRKLMPAFLFQIFPFLHSGTWESSLRVAPDMLALSLASLLLALLLPALLRARESPAPREAAIAGSLGGAILATKITGLPFFLLLAIVLRKPRALAVFLVTGAAAFIAALLFALGSSVPEFFRFFMGWVFGNLARQGQYGMGQAGLPSATSYVENFFTLCGQAPFYVLTFLVCVAACALEWRKKDWSKELTLIALLSGLSALQFLIVSKQPTARYLMPVFPSLGLAAAVLVWQATRESWGPSLQRVLLPCSLAIVLAQPALLLYSTKTEARIEQLKEKDALALKIGCRVIPFYWASGRDVALDLANYFARGQFNATFQKVFPAFLLFDPTRGVFLDAERKPVSSGKVFSDAAGKVCLRGSGRALLSGVSVPGWKAKLAYASEPDSLFELERIE